MHSYLSSIVLPLLLLQANSPRQQDTQLAEYSETSGRPQISPIAVIRHGKLIDPILYREPGNDAKALPFLRLNYATGAKFSVYHSGQFLGAVQLASRSDGCYSDFIQGVEPIGKLHTEHLSDALATSREIVGSQPRHTRNATQSERTAFIEASRLLVSAAYPSVTPKTRYKVKKLSWTTASTSGSPLLTGSISFAKAKNEFWLFAIFESYDSKWHPAISEIHRIMDLEDRKDAVEENYLDQLDIDGDGVD